VCFAGYGRGIRHTYQLLFTLKLFTLKSNFYTLVVLAIILNLSATVHAQTTSNDISSDWYNQALKSIQQLEYEIKPVRTAGFFSAATITSRTGFFISPDGYNVTPMQLKAYLLPCISTMVY
jgi:hypothetical protein